MTETRKPWAEYFMDLALLVAERGTCDRAKVGCVIVNKDHRVVSTGYNGSTYGSKHCDDVGHIMVDNHCVATVHAEMNALLYCAKEGIAVKDCTIYVTHFPCLNCAKALIQAGINKIIYKNDYRMDENALRMLRNSCVSYVKI